MTILYENREIGRTHDKTVFVSGRLIQIVPFTPADFREIQLQARQAEIGGKSQIHTCDKKRMERLREDQLVGMLGHWALSIWVTGSPEAWRNQRAKANRNPTTGDGGVDLFINGRAFDVKTSKMRAGPDPLRYNLIVRPQERHTGLLYVLALYPPEEAHILLVGWLAEKNLPDHPTDNGPFTGAFVVPAEQLHEMRREKP